MQSGTRRGGGGSTRFRRMRRVRWGVVVSAIILMLFVVGILWEHHLGGKLKGGDGGRVVLMHSGRPSPNGKPPTYMYVPNGGVIRVEGDEDNVVPPSTTSSQPTTTTPPSQHPHSVPDEGMPNEAAVYVRSVLKSIPAPPLITSDSTLENTVKTVLGGIRKLLPSTNDDEYKPVTGRDGVFPIVLQVAGTGLSSGHLSITLGQVWGRIDGGSREWRTRRSVAPPRLPPTLQNGTSSRAGWYCVSVSVMGLAGRGSWGSVNQVLSTSFVITDPTNKHNPSEFGVTPTSLQLFPHTILPTTQTSDGVHDHSPVVVMRPSGAVKDVAYPTAYFAAMTSPTTTPPLGILQTLLQLPRLPRSPYDDDAPYVFIYPEGPNLLATHRQASRMCIPQSNTTRVEVGDESSSSWCVPIVNKMGSYLSNAPLVLKDSACPIVNGVTLRRERREVDDIPPLYDRKAITTVSTFDELKAWIGNAAGDEVSVVKVDATIVVPSKGVLVVGGSRSITMLFCAECSLIVAGTLSTHPSTPHQTQLLSNSIVAQLSLLAQHVTEGWGGLVVEAGGRADLHDVIISGTGSKRVKRMKGTGTHIKRPPAITVAPSPTHHGMPLSDIKGSDPIHTPQLSLTRCALTDLHGPGLGLGRGSTAVLEGVLVQAAAQGLECVECTISVSGSAFLDVPHTHYLYSTFRDEDNDGMYFRGGHAEVVGCVVANTADDGIDSASNKNDPKPSSLTIKNTLISNIQHEGIALSGSVGAHRTVVIEDVVIEGCQQGVENGHSPDTHHATLRRVLLLGNQIGVRHGDDYKLAVDGRLEGEDVIFMATAAPPHIAIPGIGNTVPYADIVLSEMRKHGGEVHHGSNSHTKWLGPNTFHYRRDHALFNCTNCAVITAANSVSAASTPLLSSSGNICGERVVGWS